MNLINFFCYTFFAFITTSRTETRFQMLTHSLTHLLTPSLFYSKSRTLLPSISLLKTNGRQIRPAAPTRITVKHAICVEECAASFSPRASAHPFSRGHLSLSIPAQRAHGTRTIAHRVEKGAAGTLPESIIILALQRWYRLTLSPSRRKGKQKIFPRNLRMHARREKVVG